MLAFLTRGFTLYPKHLTHDRLLSFFPGDRFERFICVAEFRIKHHGGDGLCFIICGFVSYDGEQENKPVAFWTALVADNTDDILSYPYPLSIFGSLQHRNPYELSNIGNEARKFILYHGWALPQQCTIKCGRSHRQAINLRLDTITTSSTNIYEGHRLILVEQ